MKREVSGMNYPILPCGDCAVTVQAGNEISEETNRRVVELLQTLAESGPKGIRELVPSYSAVCIHYDPAVLSYDALIAYLKSIEIKELSSESASQQIVEIPVCYGGEYGPDLDFVAQHNGLSAEDVVAIHSGGTYLVYMLGFLPGFAYMGGMDERIATPRLTSPRAKIPAGSVGIAGGQTGIYPLSSPGGWQLIGRTPLKLFTMEGETARFALSAGNMVRFVPITEKQFREMEASV